MAPATSVLLCAVALTACSGRNNFWSDSPRYGPRIVQLGQPVPKGGGKYKIGLAYHDAKGRVYQPREDPHYDRTGIASWYGEDFHGRRTANGEIYDMEALTAAHTTLPLPSYARVTNLKNGRTLVVRINDRGPYVDNRIIDLSWAVASLLQIESAGTGHVRVQYIGPAPLDGNDRHERQILAQQPWAGPRVAYAASPAKALRSVGGWQQYSSVEPSDGNASASAAGTDNSGDSNPEPGNVREKFIRDRLPAYAEANPDKLWPGEPGEAAPQKMATLALASVDEEAGAAPRRAPAPTPIKPVALPAPQPRPQAQKLATALPLAQPQTPPAKPVTVSPAQTKSPKAQGQDWAATTQPSVQLASAVTPAPASKSAPKKPVSAKPAAAPAATPKPHAQANTVNVAVFQTPALPPVQQKPAAIYIEAGVFRERALADKLVAILTEIAPANIELAQNGTGIVHRVKVGPFDKNEAAQAAAARIRAAGLHGARIIASAQDAKNGPATTSSR